MRTDLAQRIANLEKLLDPQPLKANLVIASVYLASYEILMAAIMDDRRRYLVDAGGITASDRPDIFRDAPTSEHLRHYFDWHKRLGAIDDDDIALIHEIRQHRNDIAHEMPKYISDTRYSVNRQLLDSIHFLVGKIDRWWIIEIEVSPNFPGIPKNQITDCGIKSHRMATMNWIHMIIHGEEKNLIESLTYIQSLRNRGDKQSS